MHAEMLLILTLVYKASHNLTPSYISDCLSRYIPNRMLRSSSAGLLAYYTVNPCIVAYDHNSV